MKRPTRRTLMFAGIVFLVLVVMIISFRTPPALVDSAVVTRGPFQITVEEEGRTRLPDRFEVSAPVAGHLNRVILEPGDEVAQGDTLFTLNPGMRVELERWGGDDVLPGRVRRIEPAGFTHISALGVEEQRVWVIVDFESDREEWKDLGDGYRVEARFILWEGEDVLQIPASALFREEEAWAVYVIEEGEAVRRTVTPGRRSGLFTEIQAGLEPGERVILHPGQDIQPGRRVESR